MRFQRTSRAAAEVVAVLGLLSVSVFAGCGSSSNSTTAGGENGSATQSHSSSSSGSSSGATLGGSSGSTGSSSGGLGSSGDDTTGSSSGGDDATTAAGDDASALGDDGGDGSAGTDGGPTSEAGPTSDDAPATTPPPACMKGQVPPSKVAIIGDSYLDYPAWSNVAPDLFMDARNAGSLGANAQYREYQLGGAAMNYGTLNLNIPYQYETTLKGDAMVTNPADVDTIVMDGGGNDVLIDNPECMTQSTPPTGSDQCSTAIAGTLTRAQSLLNEMSSDGVKHIVYFFYPHLDPAGGGLLPTPAPQVNTTLDYAYPMAAKICCGSSFTGTASTPSCTGTINGTTCTFIDTRPAFEGHVADYIKDDHVHPTPAGSQVIADLIWNAMTSNCIAQ